MKLCVFQAGSGDCLLLTSARDRKRVLVDGGLAAPYRSHVAPALAKLQKERKKLDLVYLSHIDNDHISGILKLMDDLVAWRVFDHQSADGSRRVREPKVPRPPEVEGIWHNAFHDQIDRNAGDVDDMIAAAAADLAGGGRALADAFDSLSDLAQGVTEGVELTYRVGEQLRIPLNEQFGGKLILAREGQRPVKLGTLALTVIGPFRVDIENLREKWNEWLRTNADDIEAVRRAMAKDTEKLATGDFEGLRAGFEARAGKLGNRKGVTVPNLASLMLLAEEGGKQVLLTGDGHSSDIVRGLEGAGRLDAGGGIHVDVLKVQHHGASANIDEEFCRRVTADHYVFCGNGAHDNPELDAIEAILDARLGEGSVRTTNPDADGKFKLWFNSSSTVASSERNRAHMQGVERLVRERAAASRGRVQHSFLNGSSFEIVL